MPLVRGSYSLSCLCSAHTQTVATSVRDTAGDVPLAGAAGLPVTGVSAAAVNVPGLTLTTQLLARDLAVNTTSVSDSSCTGTAGSAYPTPSAVSITEAVGGVTGSLTITPISFGTT
jgi:hypothetical protein